MIELVKLPPELKSAELSEKQRNYSHFLVGSQGELQAKKFLLSKNIRIVGHNVRYKQYEVDLIAFDSITQQTIFVEVKTRSTNQIEAHTSITNSKIRTLQRFAGIYSKLYYKQYKKICHYRIDAICITNNQLDHFQDITWWL